MALNENEYIGLGSAAELKNIISEISAKSVFLVTGKGSFEQKAIHEAITTGLKSCKYERFSDFSPNPKYDEVLCGTVRFLEGDHDCIIAVGGGSVLDFAKSVNLFQSNWSERDRLLTNPSNAVASDKPLVAIPTTSGTGSEVTHFAVVYKDSIKYSLAQDFMLPDYVVLDPLLSREVPADVAATCAFDAFSQSIESYWAVGATSESQNYARKSILILKDNAVDAVVKRNPKAMDLVALAAFYSGKAINISKTTAAHAMSYPLTTHYSIPHGHAVALTLGDFFVENALVNSGNVQHPEGVESVLKTQKELRGLLGWDTPTMARDGWKKLMSDCALFTRFPADLGRTISIPLILEGINLDRLSNHPINVSQEIIVRLIHRLI